MEVGLIRARKLYIEIVLNLVCEDRGVHQDAEDACYVALRSERALVSQVGLRSDGCT